jgi:Spy/CpxP family protein refolding chaperone
MRNKFCTFALTGLLTVGLAGSAAFAQDQAAPPPSPPNGGMQGHRMDPDQQLQHMTKQLDLSADQQTQIKPILESRQQQMQALWQDQSLSQQDRRAKMKDIQQDSSGKIEAVLNDTQKQKYEAMQAQMKARAMQHRQGDQAPSPDSAPPAPQL